MQFFAKLTGVVTSVVPIHMDEVTLNVRVEVGKLGHLLRRVALYLMMPPLTPGGVPDVAHSRCISEKPHQMPQ